MSNCKAKLLPENCTDYKQVLEKVYELRKKKHLLIKNLIKDKETLIDYEQVLDEVSKLKAVFLQNRKYL
jgi:hypothetical protein